MEIVKDILPIIRTVLNLIFLLNGIREETHLSTSGSTPRDIKTSIIFFMTAPCRQGCTDACFPGKWGWSSIVTCAWSNLQGKKIIRSNTCIKTSLWNDLSRGQRQEIYQHKQKNDQWKNSQFLNWLKLEGGKIRRDTDKYKMVLYKPAKLKLMQFSTTLKFHCDAWWVALLLRISILSEIPWNH